MLQSMEILNMTALELSSYLENLALENPVVDLEEPEAPGYEGIMRGKIEFRDVWFAYENEDWVLRGLSFSCAPGEKIAFKGGYTYVNGEKLDESYLPAQGITTAERVFEVPEGCIFVMGDNRNDSTDSRDNRIGMVDSRLVIGKVYITLFPFAHFGSVYK